jgi:2,3-bisphosphoglycerate-independent phosphoglycerate mutase
MASSGISWTLPDHPKLPKGKPVAVVVLDGWGEANPDQYNCIHVAQTPVMDSLKNVCMLSFTPALLFYPVSQSHRGIVYFFLVLIVAKYALVTLLSGA